MKDKAEDTTGGKISHTCWRWNKVTSDPSATSNIGGEFLDTKAFVSRLKLE